MSLVADLSHNALLAVTGDDATAFLHAQLTNDVQALPAGAAQWNGWCSAKGRLLAVFLLIKRADGYLLMLPAEIAAPIAKRLAMFVLRSKVKIADVTGQYVRLGVIGAGPDSPAAPMQAAETDGVLRVALDAKRAVVIAPAAGGAPMPATAAQDAWEASLIEAGIPNVYAATQDAFVPQMVNLELIGGVSFKKGCYPGQEIVARTQYRGILKRRMARAHVHSPTRPAPGQSLYGAAFGEQAAGTIVNAAPASDGGWDLLAVAQIESLRAGDLHLDSPTGAALRILEHPALEAAS